MKVVASDCWRDANQRYLATAIDTLRDTLKRYIARSRREPEAQQLKHANQLALQELASSMLKPPALETLAKAFGLSSFERDLLLLCAGVELDSSFARLIAEAQGDPHLTHPTFSLALAALSGAHWSALTTAAPLRHWKLVEVGAGNTLTQSPLSIDERVLHYLVGLSHLDGRLQGLVRLLFPPTELPASHQIIVRRIADIWSHVDLMCSSPIIQLHGEGNAGMPEIAAFACSGLGVQLHAIQGSDIPNAVSEREFLSRLWEREAVFGSVLFVDCQDMDGTEYARSVQPFIENLRAPLILMSREPLPVKQRLAIRLSVKKPTLGEQRAIWCRSLSRSAHLYGEIDKVLAQFSLGMQGIYSASADVLAQLSENAEASPDLLWEACRAQSRPQLGGLAQRIEPVATWRDLVLPETQIEILHNIAVNIRQRNRVYEDWGFAAKNSRGLGISVLFAGPSGTGKTMAAEVLANELHLDLYRIDLSQVVSKYIGETEKNLRRTFDAAEGGGAILLFDEADALFGKRSEVKDSHDRYANIEISYLLQRMEGYRGLSILTTNMKEAIDAAFMRRIRFIVQFPFPDNVQRAEIWRRIFPPNTPTQGLDVKKLAHLDVTGGNIHNIALNAAFLAANEREPVEMKHLLRAARAEYAKLERPLTEAEIGDWV